MAKRVRLKDVKRVDLEINAWLIEWTMNPTWNLEDFGAYWLVTLMLYEHGGKMELDLERLATMCRSEPTKFAKTWREIESKFTLSGNYLFQKRVLNELRQARKRIQTAINAGVKGAEKRWGSHNDPNAKRITKRNEDYIITNITNTKEKAHLLTASVRFADDLEKALKPKTKSDRTSLLNLCHWSVQAIREGRLEEDVFERIIGIARESKGRNPMAVFFSRLSDEVGYRAKAEKIRSEF
jgi:uncharacterized protein YdaU (DUF1376 family)